MSHAVGIFGLAAFGSSRIDIRSMNVVMDRQSTDEPKKRGHYDRFYADGGWEYSLREERRKLKKWVVPTAGWKRGHHVLEIGCGMGLQARLLSDLGLTVTAVDASAIGIERATAPCLSSRSRPTSAAARAGPVASCTTTGSRTICGYSSRGARSYPCGIGRGATSTAASRRARTESSCIAGRPPAVRSRRRERGLKGFGLPGALLNHSRSRSHEVDGRAGRRRLGNM